jgi:hypothetical protein
MYYCPFNTTFVPQYAYKCGGGGVPSCVYRTVCVRVDHSYPSNSIGVLFGTAYCNYNSGYGCYLSITEAIGGAGYCNNEKPSDIRLKENIVLVGKSETGINIYQFNYKNEEGLYEGVIAQELIGTDFEDALVIKENGMYSVDYNKTDVEFKKIK